MFCLNMLEKLYNLYKSKDFRTFSILYSAYCNIHVLLLVLHKVYRHLFVCVVCCDNFCKVL